MFRTQSILAVAITFAVATESFAEWSQFRGDAGHTAYVHEHFDVSNLQQVWSASLPYAVDIASQGGSLFVTQRNLDGDFSGVATVSRVNRFTGAVEWSTDLPYYTLTEGVSAPAIQGNTVFVHRWGHSTTSNPHPKPALIGIDAVTGTQLFATEHSGQWDSGSRPTVDGSSVFVAGGYYGGLDAYGLDGTHEWFAKLNSQYGWIPAADTENVYSYMGEAAVSPGPRVGCLYIVDRLTGACSSISHPRSTGTLSRSTDNGSVMLDGFGNAYALSIVPGGKTLVCFDITGGRIRWEADGAWVDNPAVANGLVALPEGHSVVFLDALTGTRQWSWEHTANVNGSVVLTDNVAFVDTQTGVYAIDLDSHSATWNTPIHGQIAAVEEMLYITSPTGICAFHVVPEPSCFAVLAGMTVFGLRRKREELE